MTRMMYRYAVKILSKLGFYAVRELTYFSIISKFAKLLRLKSDKLLCLDLGCGNGKITKMSSKVCDTIIGIDIKRSNEWVVNDKMDYIVADARKIPLRQESMNLITVLSLLEHVPKWNEVIAEISRALRAVGVAIIQLPNLYFVIEPHTKFPLLAILPKGIRHKIAQLNSYGDLQFDCTINNVIATVAQYSLKLVGVYAHWHSAYKTIPIMYLVKKMFPPPSWFVILLKNRKPT
jgi:ubiquinone/menaquinone biosynthesis C-methylase UbiE